MKSELVTIAPAIDAFTSMYSPAGSAARAMLSSVRSPYVDLIRRPGLQLWSAVIVTVLIVSTMWLGVTDFRLEGFDRSAVLFLLSSVFRSRRRYLDSSI